MHSVYFIQAKPGGKQKGDRPVKIGYSKNPEKRAKELQTGNPNELVVIVSLPFESESEAREMEGTMHYLARKKHQALMGEWFIIYGGWPNFIAACYKIFDGNKKNKKPY